MVKNPLKDINDKINEFANSAADFSAMTPEKLIDITDKDKDALGSGREDFDAIMKPAVDNKASIPESIKESDNHRELMRKLNVDIGFYGSISAPSARRGIFAVEEAIQILKNEYEKNGDLRLTGLNLIFR